MKRIAVVFLLAAVLAGFLVVVPSTHTTHAASNNQTNCTQASGLEPDKGLYQTDDQLDLWPCLSGSYGWYTSYVYASFTHMDNFGWNPKATCSITIRTYSHDANTQVATRDCTWDAKNGTIGAFYWGSNITSYGYTSAVATITLTGVLYLTSEYYKTGSGNLKLVTGHTTVSTSVQVDLNN